MAGTDNREPWDDYKKLLKELELYDPPCWKSPSYVVANKMDETWPNEPEAVQKEDQEDPDSANFRFAFDQGTTELRT